MTPSSSASSMISSRPVVAATTACSGSRPVANALGAGSEMTKTRGIGVPVVIERFSTVRQSRGWSALLCSSIAPDMASACRSAVKYWKTA